MLRNIKTVKIMLNNKKGGKADCKNYKSISVTSSIDKTCKNFVKTIVKMLFLNASQDLESLALEY